MKLVKWLSPPSSAVNGEALIEVEANEIGDIEEMVKLVDGDNVGNFGYAVHIVMVGKQPEIKPAKYGGRVMGRGYYEAKEQFGFPNVGNIKKKNRYYRVFVHRD